eukprot:2119635-Pleurochrysis_carterae.AAC.9
MAARASRVEKERDEKWDRGARSERDRSGYGVATEGLSRKTEGMGIGVGEDRRTLSSTERKRSRWVHDDRFGKQTNIN